MSNAPWQLMQRAPARRVPSGSVRAAWPRNTSSPTIACGDSAPRPSRQRSYGVSSDTSVVAGDPGRMLLSIEVPDVDVLLPRVAELGGESTSGANDMPWGQRVAHIKDPDGNVLILHRRYAPKEKRAQS